MRWQRWSSRFNHGVRLLKCLRRWVDLVYLVIARTAMKSLGETMSGFAKIGQAMIAVNT